MRPIAYSPEKKRRVWFINFRLKIAFSEVGGIKPMRGANNRVGELRRKIDRQRVNVDGYNPGEVIPSLTEQNF